MCQDRCKTKFDQGRKLTRDKRVSVLLNPHISHTINDPFIIFSVGFLVQYISFNMKTVVLVYSVIRYIIKFRNAFVYYHSEGQGGKMFYPCVFVCLSVHLLVSQSVCLSIRSIHYEASFSYRCVTVEKKTFKHYKH